MSDTPRIIKTMGSAIDKNLRRLLTGISFALFGLGSLDIAFVIYPLILVLSRNANQRRRWLQNVISWHFRVFLKLLQVLGLMTLRIENIKRLRADKGTLVIANHPTLIDVVVLMALMPEVDCVVKEGLNRNIFLRGVVRAAGYITNSDPESLLAGCEKSLRQGRNMIVFPEGTRSVVGKPFSFQRGTAHVALRSGCPVRPVYLECNPPTLSKAHKWYDIPDRPFAFHVRVGDLIDVTHIKKDQALSLATRQMTRSLEQHYQAMLKPCGSE